MRIKRRTKHTTKRKFILKTYNNRNSKRIFCMRPRIYVVFRWEHECCCYCCYCLLLLCVRAVLCCIIFFSHFSIILTRLWLLFHLYNANSIAMVCFMVTHRIRKSSSSFRFQQNQSTDDRQTLLHRPHTHTRRHKRTSVWSCVSFFKSISFQWGLVATMILSFDWPSMCVKPI